jgi:hypothetical protein
MRDHMRRDGLLVGRRSQRVKGAVMLALALGTGLSAHAGQLETPPTPVSIPDPGTADKSHSADSLGHIFDVLGPYASVSVTNDSNVYRLDDRAESIGARGDQITTLAVGFNSKFRSGQQQYLLDGEFSPTWYNHHSNINYNGGKASAVWHWVASDVFIGTAGYRFSQTLRNFANQLYPNRVVDVRTENRVLATADHDLPDNWKFGVRGDFADVTFNHSTKLDIRRTTGGATLSFDSRAGNSVGFDLQLLHGDYKDSGTLDFNEYTVGPTLQWKYTVRTQLVGNVGYTRREYSNSTKPNYGDVTGRFTLTIADAGRGSLSATIWRELSNLGDEIAEYAVVDGFGIDPAWTLSNGLTARVHGGYEHRDFRVVSGVESDRIDDVGNVSGFLDWPIGRHFKISGGVVVERRSSTRFLQAYQFLQQQIQFVGTL